MPMEALRVKTVVCAGSPFEIGFTHGRAVSSEVHNNVSTYTAFFKETAQITWEQARERASRQFIPTLESSYPEILEEMEGIAQGAGAGLTLNDILTLNVRSEIALTNYADGCTSLSQQGESGRLFIAQNWDWLEELHKGLAFLHIKPMNSDLEIHFLAEAGIVGKAGMNSKGFGLAANALRSGAYNKEAFPVHVMTRRLLQYATSLDSAIAIIENFGLASTTNYMLGDSTGKHVDIECSPHGNIFIQPQNGFIAHTNHLCGPNRPHNLIDHPADNSFTRLARMQELTENDRHQKVPPTFESIRTRLSDEQGKPFSICRDRPPGAVGMERMTTLGTVIMELKSLTGEILIGRPCDDVPIFKWSF